MEQAFSPAKIFRSSEAIYRKKVRYCQHNWFNTFEFLHYDVSKDAVFCYVHSGWAAEEDKEGEKAIPLLYV